MNDADRLSVWISTQQSECGTRSGVVYHDSYMLRIGFAAQLVALKIGFANALASGHIFHFPPTHYAHTHLCPERSFACYFEPITPCAPSHHPSMIRRPVVWCSGAIGKTLARLAGLKSVHSEAWYHAQIQKYVWRLRPTLRAAYHADGINLDAPDLANRTIALHVRLSDKMTEDPRQEDRGIERYRYLAKQIARWRLGSTPHRHFLGSEDPQVAKKLHLANTWQLPPSLFAMNMIGDNVFHDIKQNTRRLNYLYKHNLTTRDEGAALIALMDLMARATQCIGSYSSNMMIVVADLRKARGLSDVADVLGRPYCGCGASLCMYDERASLSTK